jgi:hypothetical protein
MGLFDWRSGARARPEQPVMAPSEDEQAIARYRYLLKTAPPEAIEQAHAEAFAQLTPEQRRMVLEQLAAEAPEGERARVDANGANPQELARLATRTEMRRPGTLERAFGGAAMPGFGGMMAGSLLGSVAGTVLGSMIAREFFTHDQHFGDGDHSGAGDHAAPGDQHGALPDDASSDSGLGGDADFGGFDDGGTFDV